MARSSRKKPRKKITYFPLSRSQHFFLDSLESALSLSRSYSAVTRYSLALLITALATVLKIGLVPLIGKESPYLFVLPAVLLSTWFGGVGPGILSAILTVLSIFFFFLPPVQDFVIPNVTLVAELFIYLIEAALVIFIVYRRNRAAQQMRERAAQQAIVAATGQFGIEEQDTELLMDRVVRAIGETLGVDHCSIFELLPDGKSFRLTSGTGWKRGLVRRIIIKGEEGIYEGYTLKQNKPVIVTDITREKRFEFSHILEGHPVVSAVSVPISGRVQPFGVLSVHTSKKRIFSKDDINFIRSMANVLATTFERKASREELALMASLNTQLTSSLNPQESLKNLVQLVVPHFAEFSEVYVKQDGEKTELIEVAAKEKSKGQALLELVKQYPPEESSKRPLGKVLHSGRGLLISVVTPNWIEKVAEDEGHKELLEKLSLRSLIIVPVKLRSQTIGVITFGSTHKGRVYGHRDLQIAQEIANRAAVAIDNGRLYKEAQEAIQARDEFLSIASHELKTPLTSLLLQLQTVLHSIKNESLASFSIDRTLASLESMIGQSKRINRLVNDLLNISLITTGKMNLEKEEADLTTIVQDVALRLKEQAEKSGSSISIEGEKSIVGYWDKIRLEQVVTNLLTNAIKYGNKKPVQVQVSNSNKTANLVVIDQGIGIPKDKQKTVFDRFTRATNAKKSYKGLGVGLYLVQQIVRAHGGTIEVTSKPNKGSTFSVTLPLQKS